MWKFVPEVKVVAETKWIRLENLQFTDERGKKRSWDRCVRCHNGPTTGANEPDAVIIVATTETPENPSEKQVILVQQFRPALGVETIEFPAGLIDEGETPEIAGLRELKEETGYFAPSQPVESTLSPILCLSPGLTKETCQILHITCPTQAGSAQPEEEENITVLLFPLKNLLQHLKSYHSKNPEVMIFEGIYTFAMGLEFANI